MATRTATSCGCTTKCLAINSTARCMPTKLPAALLRTISCAQFFNSLMNSLGILPRSFASLTRPFRAQRPCRGSVFHSLRYPDRGLGRTVLSLESLFYFACFCKLLRGCLYFDCLQNYSESACRPQRLNPKQVIF